MNIVTLLKIIEFLTGGDTILQFCITWAIYAVIFGWFMYGRRPTIKWRY